MNLEIIKGIKLTGIGIQKVGDKLTMDEKSGGAILIKMGFAKEDKETKLIADQVAELIDKTETIEELKAFESDKRQVVAIAYKKKLKELSE